MISGHSIVDLPQTDEQTSSLNFTVRATNCPYLKRCDSLTLRISVGFRQFSGDRFRAIVHWLTKRPHTPQFLLISDSLMRHNYESEMGYGASTALELAKVNGLKWFKREKRNFERARHKIEFLKILWWDDIRLDVEFDEHLDLIRTLYDEWGAFRNEVERDVERYVNTKRQRGEHLDWGFLKQKSTDFILEEIAVHNLLLKRQGGCHAYPSNQLHAEEFLGNHCETLRGKIFYSDRYFIRLKIESGPR